MSGDDGRRRVIIEGVKPEIDCGRFPIKRTVGEKVVVEADAFTDGHDAVCCLLLWRRSGVAPLTEEPEPWRETPMSSLGNDRWRGCFTAGKLGRWEYTIVAWVDHWQTWRRDLEKRIAAGQDVAVDLQIGAELVRAASRRAADDDARALASLASDVWGDPEDEREAQQATALDPELDRLVRRYPDRAFATEYGKVLGVVVDRERARFSSWYELFPRSTGDGGRHGTFRDAERRLEYVAKLGFDVVYLPPIHPIGHTHRKGKNNRTVAEPRDVGSPWAIGSEEGGHTAVHPELGTLEDVRRFAARARELGMEVALDVAFQCSPDHPYVRQHPEWFRRRPDGTIQYAENPPKKYEDIYPFDFDTTAWRELWTELESVVRFWIEQGVCAFRVDNPHTKPFAFWEWAIGEIKRDHPEVIFLSEAFTRPKVMYRLAKLGFSQSYTYFAWRHTKQEFTDYLTELTATEVAEFFRPSFWPNTPDILTERLQHGGRPAFVQRLVLAATLAASYGTLRPGVRAYGARGARARQRGVPRLGEIPAPAVGPRAARTAWPR